MSAVSGDCDDNDALISPARDEVCDGIDNDCNDEIDDGVLQTFYADTDGDGYGDPNQSSQSCEAAEGMVDNGDDCNDLETLAHPNFFEICDGVDNNCDNQIDEDTALDTIAFYADFDNDGHGNPNNISYACNLPDNHVTVGDDCDDANNLRSPSQLEDCDGIDNDCDEEIDEENFTEGTLYYFDSDNDGYGNPEMSMMACSVPIGYRENADDCDDNDDDNYLDADELCDGIDNDCDGEVDNDTVDSLSYYIDLDGDGFGTVDSLTEGCTLPENASLNAGDCDDDNDMRYENAVEICDEIDNDCDDEVDNEAIDLLSYYIDLDGDGFGTVDSLTEGCTLPENASLIAGDCDDDNDMRYESAVEICDEIDNDCDDEVDENAIGQNDFYIDLDGDGFGGNDYTVWDF